MSRQKRVLLLSKYGRLGASSRLRTLQYLPWLKDSDLLITTQLLLSDDKLQARYRVGFYGFSNLMRSYVERVQVLLRRRKFDLIWIEKESLPWWPLSLELLLLGGKPFVLDFDDAVFHNYDQHKNPLVRLIFGKRLDGLMRNASLVVGGNNYLAQRARDAGAKWVEVLPTVIDLDRYRQDPNKLVAVAMPAAPLKLVWIGTPGNVHYLELIREPLLALAAKYSIVLRVIGATEFSILGLQVEVLPWNESTEVQLIRDCDIGVMPLLDSPWEKGKCGYKLIQYMACGLPVLASSVGVNSEIVHHGINGYLATTPKEWETFLGHLLEDESLRRLFGIAGRKHVESNYCIQKTGPKLAAMLHKVIDKASVCAD